MTVLTLRPRQIEVLRLVSGGLTDRQAGEQLGISEGAARNHVYRASKLLGGRNRVHAVVLAHELGLLDGPR